MRSTLILDDDFGFRPGVDLDKLNQLAGELEAEAAAEPLGRAT